MGGVVRVLIIRLVPLSMLVPWIRGTRCDSGSLDLSRASSRSRRWLVLVCFKVRFGCVFMNLTSIFLWWIG